MLDCSIHFLWLSTQSNDHLQDLQCMQQLSSKRYNVMELIVINYEQHQKIRSKKTKSKSKVVVIHLLLLVSFVYLHFMDVLQLVVVLLLRSKLVVVCGCCLCMPACLHRIETKMNFFSSNMRRIPHIPVWEGVINNIFLIFMPPKNWDIFEHIKSFLTCGTWKLKPEN